MKADDFIKKIKNMGISTFAGVPDSALNAFCEYLNDDTDKDIKHYVTANEGAAVGIAIGTYLASQNPACIYMQNSGLGNCVNPLTSLAHAKVYHIPMLLVIGWRGEPDTKDEPQHKFMGEITKPLLRQLQIPFSIIGTETKETELKEQFENARQILQNNKQYAFIIKRNTLTKSTCIERKNGHSLTREAVISEILKTMNPIDFAVATTGKISREVYEQSEKIFGNHDNIFLTVGGMGHASMIAFGIAANNNKGKVFLFDGDGAALMHLGNIAFIGKQKPSNFIHILLNNDAHESVGGFPTGAAGLSYSEIARQCGYEWTACVEDKKQLNNALHNIKQGARSVLLEVRTDLYSRGDLGRPKETAEENKQKFMSRCSYVCHYNNSDIH